MFTQRRILACLCAIAALLFGCTRASNGGDASIRISLPDIKNSQAKASAQKVGALDATQVHVLIINVSGPDIPTPIFYQWNVNDVGGTAPSVVTLTVPQGTGRIVQVVVGYDGSNGMSLNYGATTADLTSTTADVDVTVSSLSTNTGMEGRIAGRYLTAAGIGPTGILNVFLTPPGSTLPPVLVEQSEMIGGYFDIFGMTDVGFTYKLADGTMIFPDNAKLTVDPANPLYPTNNATSMDYVPAAYRQNMSANEVPTEDILLFGYFGPGVNTSTNKVCFDNSSGTIANAWLDAAHTSAIPWSVGATTLATIRGQSAGILAGSSMVSCGGGTALTDYLRIARDNIVNGNSSVPFRGPYAENATFNYLSFTNSSGNLQVSWNYAPGVFNGPNPITGSQVFYKVGTSGSYKTGDGYNCAGLAAKGFSSGALLAGVGSTSDIIPGLNTSSSVDVIVCPYRIESGKTVYFRSAIEGYPTPPAPYTGSAPYHLMLTASPVSPGNVVNPLDPTPTNTTSNMTLQLVDSLNMAVAVGVGTAITLTTSYSLLTFDGSSQSKTVSLNSLGQATFQFVVTANVVQDAHMSFSYSGGISGLDTSGKIFLPVGLGTSGEPPNIQISAQESPASLVVGGCAPIAYYLYDGAMGTINASTTNITFSPTSSQGTFYSDSACIGTPATTVTIPAGKTIAYLYFKPSSSGASVALNMSGSPTNATPAAMTLWSTQYISVGP